MDLRIALFVLAGALLGFAADRLSARWPSHRPDADAAADRKPEADGTLTVGESSAPAAAIAPEPPPRGLDWRTPAMVLVGAIAFGALAARWTGTRDLVVLVPYFAALVVLMATDLDQRLLPDLVTLPLIPLALIAVLTGIDPLLQSKDLAIVSSVIAALGAPAFLILTSLVMKGGIGIGDLKLAVSIGLLSGISLFVVGFLVAAAASSVILVALMGARRIGRRTLIPFGPVLIGAGIIAALLP